MKKTLLFTLLCLMFFGYNAKAQSDLYVVSPYQDSLWVYDTTTWTVTNRVQLTESTGLTITGCNGLVSYDSQLYIMMKQTGVTGRVLGTVDPTTGVCTSIANTGDNIAGMALHNKDTFVVVVGDGGTESETVHFMDINTGGLQVVATTSGAGSDGETVGYCPDNKKHYRWSGRNTASAMEVYDVNAGTYTAVTQTGFNYDETFSAVYIGNGEFLLANLDQEFVIVDTSGFAQNPNPIGTNAVGYIKGMTFHEQCTVTATANSDTIDYCDGDSIVMWATGNADIYYWVNGVIDSVPYYQPVGTIDQNVAGYEFATGCLGYDTITITVGPIPNIVAMANTTQACENDPILLYGTGGATYSWDNGVMDSVAFTQTAGTTSYIVMGIDTFGCSNSDTIDVTVNAAPTVVATANQNNYCDGDMIVLNGSGAQSYSWDNGVTDGVGFTQPVGTMTYTVTGTGPNGCTGTDVISITVSPSPTVTATANQTSYCDGDLIVLNGAGATNYTWDNGVTDGVGFTQAVGTVDYTVTGTDNSGCADTDVITVEVFENPSATFASGDEIAGNDGSITTTITSGQSPYTFDWDNDGTGDNDDTQNLTGLAGGDYAVTIIDDNGCIYQDTITVDSQVGIEDFGADAMMKIYPNPTDGIFSIELINVDPQGMQVQIIDLEGREVYNSNFNTNILDVDLSTVANGVYNIVLTDGTRVNTMKIEIMH